MHLGYLTKSTAHEKVVGRTLAFILVLIVVLSYEVKKNSRFYILSLPFARKRIHGFLFSCNDGDGWIFGLLARGPGSCRQKKLKISLVRLMRKGWMHHHQTIFPVFFWFRSRHVQDQDMFFVWIRCGTVFFFQNGPPKRHSESSTSSSLLMVCFSTQLGCPGTEVRINGLWMVEKTYL